jgi:hypothetical protein
MRKRMLGKWMALCLLAMVLAFAPAGKAAAEEENSLELAMEQAAMLVKDLDVETVREYYRDIESVVMSDEFQSLLQYEEVRVLIEELVNRGVDFVMTEPELTEKILITAGMDEKYAALVLLLIGEGNKAGEAVELFKESEEGKALLEYLDLTLDRETLTKALLDLLLGQYADQGGTETEISSAAAEDLLSRIGEEYSAQTEEGLAAQTENDLAAQTEEELAAQAEEDPRD